MYTSGDIGMCSLSVLLDNGLYVFDNESAIGKTWLCEISRAINSTSLDIGYVTYMQSTDVSMYLTVMNTFAERKVIVLDRYDMYRTDATDDLALTLSNGSIVLVDTKDDNVFADMRLAYIRREENMTIIGGLADVSI